MYRRWELVLLITVLLLLAGCRTQLPAEFSRMGGDGFDSPPSAPGGGLDAGGPLAGEQDALAGQEPDQQEPGENFMGLEPEPGDYAFDALYAIPQQTTAAAGEAVRIVVASGTPIHEFQYMNGVRVTFSAGEPSFVPGSYNVGGVGGAADDPDGIWASVNPDDFLLPTDYMLSFKSYDSANGSWAMDFNVTPIGGNPASGANGELFNFEVVFAQAGTVRLGFRQFEDVKRTYYSDSSSVEYYWSNIGNDHPGVANTVVVTE